MANATIPGALDGWGCSRRGIASDRTTMLPATRTTVLISAPSSEKRR